MIFFWGSCLNRRDALICESRMPRAKGRGPAFFCGGAMSAARQIKTTIAEAAAAGLLPGAVEKQGKTWRVRLKGAARASYFRTKQRAESVLAAARAIRDAAISRPFQIRPKDDLAIPGRDFHRIEFALWEASALITSHNPHSWKLREDYPKDVQERDYTGSADERMKVERIAKNPDPRFLLARAPTAIDGPPVVLCSGAVLGGNGRSMGLILAYERGKAERYRKELRQRAPEFGFSQEAVDQMQCPVLVRILRLPAEVLRHELAALSSALNASTSNAKDEVALSIADARHLSIETISEIGELLEELTLREAMSKHPGVFAEALRRDGLIASQNREEWMDGEGGLSERGKLHIENAFLGRVFETPDRLRKTAPAIVQKIERIVPACTRVDARENGHSISDDLRSAIDAINAAQAQKMSVAEYAAQVDFTRELPRRALVLARVVADTSRLQLGKIAKQWAARADFDPKQKTLFGAHPSPAETFRVWEEAAG